MEVNNRPDRDVTAAPDPRLPDWRTLPLDIAARRADRARGGLPHAMA
jgi:hypothetical protein